MSADVSPKDLRAARDVLSNVWRHDYSRELVELRERVCAYLSAQIQQLDGRAPVVSAAPEPKIETVVFRPAPDGRWFMGYADDVRPRTIAFKYGRRAIQAAYDAISGLGPVFAKDYVRQGASAPQNALRDALKGRVADEIETRTGCTPLANAIRAIRVSRNADGLVTYPGLDDVRILTGVGSVRTDS